MKGGFAFYSLYSVVELILLCRSAVCIKNKINSLDK